jgi:DUF438 domain-containing protein
VMFVDMDHVIRYMNKAAIAHFDDGEALLGRSLMACHNQQSQQVIRQTVPMLQAGADERLISTGNENRIYMRAVRNVSGEVIGYYERYEPCDDQTV